LRGVEAALAVLDQVRQGKFASEAIRRFGDSMTPGDLTLASTLIYATLRRQFLWKEIYGRFLRGSPGDLSRSVEDSLCIGTAGLLELKNFAPRVLVNALVQAQKDKGNERGARVLNAVLRRISEEGAAQLAKIKASGASKDQALYAGIPPWVATIWRNTFGEDAKSLLKMAHIRPYSSFRVFPEEKMDTVLSQARQRGFRCWQSPLLPYGVRLGSSVYPASFPGFTDGWVTPQSEGSMLVCEAMRSVYRGGTILEMCSGRGIKTGLLSKLLPDSSIECIELSPRRVAAAEREIERLGITPRPVVRQGDALLMTPDMSPGLISLDVPCSGSGTWNRRPEGKWRLTQDKLESLTNLQRKLLKRATSLLAPGGIVVYSTCSMMKEENEGVVADVLSEDPSLAELPFPLAVKHLRKGRPWGVYVWPELPWLDGFYLAAIIKRSGGKDR